ncbi:MAG: hypothetical protein MZV70_69230 [Desulfobacterales bacterium]|nr:hypothetical protein [Desulfobacterales bacterium]
MDVDGKKDLPGADVDHHPILPLDGRPADDERPGGPSGGRGHSLRSSGLEAVLREARGQGDGKSTSSLPYRAGAFPQAQRPSRDQAEADAKNGASADLVRAIIAQREIKSEAEVAEMVAALLTTYKMYDAAMRMAQPGVWESWPSPAGWKGSRPPTEAGSPSRSSSPRTGRFCIITATSTG